MHTHHIIPKHMGGSNDPSNLIELSIPEHAEAHRVLFEEHGMWQDELAWKGLAGFIGHEEAIRLSQSYANSGKVVTEEQKKKQSEKMKGRKLSVDHRNLVIKNLRYGSGKDNAMFGKKPHNLGKHHSKETIEKIRQSKIGKKIILSDEMKKKKREIFLENTKHRRSLRGKDHPNYGMKYSEESKEKMRGSRESISGNNNPAKRIDVREKIRQSKIGIKRPFKKRRSRDKNGNLVLKI